MLNIIKSDPRHYFFLGLLVFLFLVTRLLLIDEIPASVYWDEASIGYNAYSISQNLKDEWGEFLPLHFRAFGEFKLPVYVYTVAAFVKLFGLNELSVRLPSVMFSLGIVLLIYLLTLRLTKNKTASILASFYLVTSAWFFIFSRIGYEATAGVFSILFGFYLFLFASEKKYLLLFSTAFYILAMYSYNSLRIVTPLVYVVNCAILFRNKIEVKYLVLPISIFAISLVPIFKLFFLDAGGTRFSVVGETRPVEIAKNYFSHFSPAFLFSGDKNPRSTQPGFGVIWPLDVLVIPLGFYGIVKLKKAQALVYLLIFFLSFVPAAITTESPHALRSLSAVAVLAFVWASGILYLATLFKRFKAFVLTLTVLSTLLFFENYMESFVSNYRIKVTEPWQYGYKSVFTDYKDRFENFNKIVIDDHYAQPYIFWLFYLKVNPDQFRREVVYNPPDQWGFSTVAKVGKFNFKKVVATDLTKETLVFASPQNRIQGISPISEIKFLDGSTALFVYENK